MPLYDFKYLPLSGGMPGIEFEKQTEKAINEIGNLAYESKEIAKEAIGTAKDAQANSLEALEAAHQAQAGVAENKKRIEQLDSSIVNISGDITIIEQDIGGIRNDIKNTYNLAQAADRKATDNAALIININDVLTVLKIDTEQATSTANIAIGMAEETEKIVDILSSYDQRSTIINLNDFSELARIYVKNPLSLHLPAAQTGLLDVDVTDGKDDEDSNITIVRQQFLSLVDYRLYFRSATATYVKETGETAVVWENWVTYSAYTQTEINKLIDQKIESNNTYINSTINVKIEANNSTFESKITTNLINYVDAKDFFPRKPFIGYFDDDTTANIFGSFEIAKTTHSSAHVMSDNRAVENLWYFARDGSIGSVNRLFRAQRLNDTSGWQYSNELIQPSYVPAGQYINYIFGMGSSWMIQRFNVNSSTTGHYLIDTKGSSRPEDWSIIGNVSSLLSGRSIVGCLYFPEHGTILTVDIASGVVYYRLTRVSTMTDIIPRSKLIEPMVDLITDWSFFNSINKTPNSNSQLTVFYNPYDKQLIMSPFVSLTGYRADTGMKWESNLTIFLPFLVPDNFFRDGLSAGDLVFNMTPDVDYLSPPSTSMPGFSGRSGYIPYSFVTYDERKRKIYVCETDTNNTAFYTRRLAYNNRPQTGAYLTSNYENYERVTTPDASPWAKGTNSFSYFFNDVCYFRGQSTKYGANRNVCTEYDLTTLGPNSEIIKIPGKWWIGQQQTNDAGETMHNNAVRVTFIKLSNGDMKCIYFTDSAIEEIEHQSSFTAADGIIRNGKRVITPLGVTYPGKLSGYTYLNYIYDPVRNRAYHIIRELDHGTTRQVFLRFWNGSIWQEFHNQTALLNFAATALSKNTGNLLSCNTSAVIDTDGRVYFPIRHWDSGTPMLRIDMNSSDPTKYVEQISTSRGFQNAIYEARGVSYDKFRGFTIDGQASPNSSYHTIYCSKSMNPGDPEYTADQFFVENKAYSVRISMESNVGLIAFLLQTPIFIGGYFSTTLSEEILLEPNRDNYIYLERSGESVVVIPSTTLIGGERGFSRVLVSKLTTNDHKVIDQEDYPVEWDY